MSWEFDAAVKFRGEAFPRLTVKIELCGAGGRSLSPEFKHFVEEDIQREIIVELSFGVIGGVFLQQALADVIGGLTGAFEETDEVGAALVGLFGSQAPERIEFRDEICAESLLFKCEAFRGEGIGVVELCNGGDDRPFCSGDYCHGKHFQEFRTGLFLPRIIHWDVVRDRADGFLVQSGCRMGSETCGPI